MLCNILLQLFFVFVVSVYLLINMPWFVLVILRDDRIVRQEVFASAPLDALTEKLNSV